MTHTEIKKASVLMEAFYKGELIRSPLHFLILSMLYEKRASRAELADGYCLARFCLARSYARRLLKTPINLLRKKNLLEIHEIEKNYNIYKITWKGILSLIKTKYSQPNKTSLWYPKALEIYLTEIAH